MLQYEVSLHRCGGKLKEAEKKNENIMKTKKRTKKDYVQKLRK